MSAEPRLLVKDARHEARAVALVLHGGRSKSQAPVHVTQPAVLRMLPFVLALHRCDPGLVVAQLRYRVRGWNGAARSPVPDARWALDQLVARYPALPIALVGHSMGGRTAMYAAGHSAVRVVVGLAPWIEAGDPVATLAGRRVLIAHGDLDRMTDPRASRAYAHEASRLAESMSYVAVTGDRHGMLRRPRVWNALMTGFVTGALLDDTESDGQHRRTADGPITKVVSEALTGRSDLVV